MRFEVFLDAGGRYRWRLLSDADNIAASGEPQRDGAEAVRAAREFKATAASDEYRIWQTSGIWYWDARSINGEIVATCGQHFRSHHDAALAAASVRDGAARAIGPYGPSAHEGAPASVEMNSRAGRRQE